MQGLRWVLGLALTVGAALGPVGPARALSEEAEALWAQQGPLQGALLLIRRSGSHLKGAADKGGAIALAEAERDCLHATWAALGAAAPEGRLDLGAYRRVQDQLEAVSVLFPTTLTYTLSLHPDGGQAPSFVLRLRHHPRGVLSELGAPTGWAAEPVPSGLRLVARTRL